MRTFTMATLKDLEVRLQELAEAHEALKAEHEALKQHVHNLPKGRDRGPASEGDMTEQHAIRVMLGDLKDVSHKECAILLKLSYGQIYSARKGFTFKPVYQRMIKGEIDHSFDDPNYKAQLPAPEANPEAEA